MDKMIEFLKKRRKLDKNLLEMQKELSSYQEKWEEINKNAHREKHEKGEHYAS